MTPTFNGPVRDIANPQTPRSWSSPGVDPATDREVDKDAVESPPT
jgi:hypothetical protein